MSNIVSCPSCKSTSLRMIGKIPSSDYFAGQQLSFVVPGENLYQCPACHLHFRYPRLSQNELDALYRDAKSTHWQYKDEIRHDWIFAKNWLIRIGGGKILDLGCWDGNFLANLPGQWEKFGIEINEQAAEKAKDVGVKIVGENVLHSENNLNNTFDAVTAFDISEHVEDPKTFLAQLLEYTRPGGYILIGTGNTDAWTWRLARNRYWYCWPAEHISFVNRAWFEYLTKELPFVIRDMKEFAHDSQPSVLGLIKQSVANFLYLFAPVIFYKIRLLRWKFLGEVQKKTLDFPPAWNKSRDHLFAVLQKLPSKP